jgi:hypothetical protein
MQQQSKRYKGMASLADVTPDHRSEISATTDTNTSGEPLLKSTVLAAFNKGQQGTPRTCKRAKGKVELVRKANSLTGEFSHAGWLIKK